MALKPKIHNPSGKVENKETRKPKPVIKDEPVIPPKPIINIPSKAVGWLIVHTEKLKSRSFEIYANKEMTVGRKEEGYNPDIAINFEGNTDNYFSRKHMEIFADYNTKTGTCSFYVTDTGTTGKGSTNGTYINGDSKRLPPNTRVEIYDGTTIQAGRTKLVLKTAKTVKTELEATQIVAQSPYTKTIIE